jgi:hypothetical protein
MIGRACGMYGEKMNAYRVRRGNLKERFHLDDLGTDWRIILKWIL